MDAQTSYYTNSIFSICIHVYWKKIQKSEYIQWYDHNQCCLDGHDHEYGYDYRSHCCCLRLFREYGCVLCQIRSHMLSTLNPDDNHIYKLPKATAKCWLQSWL